MAEKTDRAEAPPKRVASGPYVVANPRSIPTGVRVLHDGKQDWYEGDAIKPGDLPDEAFMDFLDRGFIMKGDA